jgi:hypothetical protein
MLEEIIRSGQVFGLLQKLNGKQAAFKESYLMDSRKKNICAAIKKTCKKHSCLEVQNKHANSLNTYNDLGHFV